MKARDGSPTPHHTPTPASASAGSASGEGASLRGRRLWGRVRLLVCAMASAALVLTLPAAGIAAAEPANRAIGVQLLAGQVQVLAQAESVDAVLTNVRNWIMGIAAALATVFITIGAVRYMAANGDLGEVEKAKTAFRSAAFGYALALLTPLVLSVLREIVGAK